ncbi:hypothetical protein T265_13029, partial [Opisthorchis viverrini]
MSFSVSSRAQRRELHPERCAALPASELFAMSIVLICRAKVSLPLGSQHSGRPAVAPFQCLAAMPHEGGTRAWILPVRPSLDRGSRAAEMFGVLQRFARRMAIPGCFLTWDTSVTSLNSRTDSLIKRARAVYDQIGSVSNPTWRSVAQSLSYFEAEYSVEKEMLTFPQYVFPDKSVRDASCDAARKISDVEVELEMRKDVFDQFVHIQSHLDSTVPAEMKRYVDRKVRDGRRAGLHLDEKGRKKIEELSKEENRLCIDFQRALDEENTVLEFTEEELAGCPEDFLRGLKKLRFITLSAPNCHATGRKHEGRDTARLPKSRQGKSRCRGRVRTMELS